MRRQCADAPARHGCGRLAEARGHSIFGVMPRESGASSNPKTRISTDLPGVTGSPAFAGDDTTERRGNDAIERSERRKRNTSAYASPSACAAPSHVGEAPDGDADGAGTFRRKLKPAGGRHGKPRNFGDHGAKSAMRTAMPQSFLKTGEHRLLVSRFHIDHPVRRKPGRSECRREQILAGHAPQHAPPRPRRDPGGKEYSGSPVDRAVTAARHFVQRAERQSGARSSLPSLLTPTVRACSLSRAGVPPMAWLHQRMARRLRRLRMVVGALDAVSADAGH